MFSSVADLISRSLGIHTSPGEGVAWSIEYAWPWPAWLTLLLAIAAVSTVIAVYWRERGRASRRYRLMLASMRLGLLGILLMMIAQVTLSIKRNGLPYIALVLDDSLSMSTADRYEDNTRQAMQRRLKAAGIGDREPSRWLLARTLLSERDNALLRGITENYKLRAYFLTGNRRIESDGTAGVAEEIGSTTPSGDRTQLGAGVRYVLDDLRGATPAAIVLVTDGINTDGPPLREAADDARRRGVPLLLVGLGGDRPARDLKLSDLLVDDVVLLGDIVTFDCKLTAAGFRGKKVSVVLREKDRPDVLAKVEVTIDSEAEPKQVRIPFRPTKAGRFQYVVEVEPQQGELQVENNRQTRTVEVRKDKLRVLLVQAYPNFEYRYLRNLLMRDETIDLHTFLQESDPGHAQQDAAALRVFPLRREELFAYDAILFGDVDPSLLNSQALQNLAAFVTDPAKGGSLVLIAGPSFMPWSYRDTPLSQLLPLRWDSMRKPAATELTEGFVVRPTDLGLLTPPMQLGDTPEETRRIWSKLPPLYWLAEVPDLKPGARILAEHPTRRGPDGRPLPVCCLQYVGSGKVLFQATDETWRWRLRVGDRYFARYWGQMLRYLCRTKLGDAGRPVSLTSDRREYDRGEPVLLRARFTDERLAPAADNGVTVVVERGGGQTERLQLHRTAAQRGAFEAVLNKPVPGDYHAWISAPAVEGRVPAADFRVALPEGEFAEIRMDAAEMRHAAEQTGGRFYTFDSADQLLDDLPPGRQTLIESLPPRPLWNTWPMLTLFLTLLTIEWILRKRTGMV